MNKFDTTHVNEENQYHKNATVTDDKTRPRGKCNTRYDNSHLHAEFYLSPSSKIPFQNKDFSNWVYSCLRVL